MVSLKKIHFSVSCSIFTTGSLSTSVALNNLVMHLCTFIIHRIPSIIAIIIDFFHAAVPSAEVCEVRGRQSAHQGNDFHTVKVSIFAFFTWTGCFWLVEHVVLSRFCCDTTCPDLPCFSRGSIMQFDILDVHIAIANWKPQRFGMLCVGCISWDTAMKCYFNFGIVVNV